MKRPETQTDRPKKGGARPGAGRKYGDTKLTLTDELLKQIEGLARIQCTLKEAGAVLGVSEPTIIDFFKRHEKARESWENGKEIGRASLRRTQHKMAETNPTMAIWLGKQWLGQKDQLLHTGDENNPIEHAHTVAIEFIKPAH